MYKIPCASQNMEVKTLTADVCIFDHFGWVSSAAVHSADCRFDSKVKWWIHVSSIVTYLHKKSYLLHWNSSKQRSELSTHCCFRSTVNKRNTHFEYSFLIDKCSCKMGNTLPFDIFNSSAISRNFNFQSAKTSLWSFLVFTWTTAKFKWPECSASFVCTATFKVCVLPLNHCFEQNRVQITLFKPLLCLNSIFSHQKAMLYQHTKFWFFPLFWKFATVASL